MKLINLHQVEACLKEDRAAQKWVFEALYPPMYRLCQRYIVNTSLAEDCVMRGMMKVFKQLGSFTYRDDTSLYLWTRKIMVNEVLMELRKRNNFFLMPENELPELTACNDILKKIDAEELFSIILQLPEGYRTVLNLFVIEGYSHKEISQLLGIKESTSKSQYHKAKARLKEILTIKENNIYGTHRK